MNTMNQYNWKRRRLFFFPLFILGLFFISGVVMFLWNLIIPEISTWSPLSYWQAMGLLVLSKILFGGFHFNRHHRDLHRAHFEHAPFRDKFMEMTTDEKQKFKDQWKNQCCKTPNPSND